MITIEFFASRVRRWGISCFGPEIFLNKHERSLRFLEEALELVQSRGLPKGAVADLVEYVYSRPKGEQRQELAGTLITLAALISATPSLEAEDAVLEEYDRIWEKIDKIRTKQFSKPVQVTGEYWTSIVGGAE